MPYKINSPSLIDLCSVGNILHCATSYSICTWPASLRYPSSGGTQATATREKPSTVDLRGSTADGLKQTAMSAHNIQQYRPNHQFKHSRCFRRFCTEVMWKFECSNRKRYTTENRRHYFTTNLWIIFPLSPIGSSTWRRRRRRRRRSRRRRRRRRRRM